MPNKIIAEEEIKKEIDDFLDARKNHKESNHQIEGKGSAIEMMLAGSKKMPKEPIF